MANKYIFLDVDGVLNNHTMLSQFDHGSDIEHIASFFGNVFIERLNKIILECGGPEEVLVILSASMRVIYSIEEVEAALRYKGFIGKVVDKTGPPVRSEPGVYPRAEEIREYLRDHKEVTNFLVLDDAMTDGELSFLHTRTCWTTGILDEHVEDAVDKLLYPPKEWSPEQ